MIPVVIEGKKYFMVPELPETTCSGCAFTSTFNCPRGMPDELNCSVQNMIYIADTPEAVAEYVSLRLELS